MQKSWVLLFLFMGILFGCDTNMKKVTIPGEKTVSRKDTLSEAPQPENPTLERIAELAAKGELHSIFSEEEILRERSLINEGMDSTAVVWVHGKGRNGVRIDFKPNSDKTVLRVTAVGKENPYFSQTGVKLGMSIDQVNSLNRKPVDFYGFNWDFGGAALFNDGFLDDKNIFVYFKTDKKVGKQFIGDSPHSFEEAKVAKLDLYVNKLVYVPAKNDKL